MSLLFDTHDVGSFVNSVVVFFENNVLAPHVNQQARDIFTTELPWKRSIPRKCRSSRVTDATLFFDIERFETFYIHDVQ